MSVRSVSRAAATVVLWCTTSVFAGAGAASHTVAGVPMTDEEVAILLEYRMPAELPPDPSNRHAGSAEAQRFGRALFFDTGLSPDGISCASCHDPRRAWSDGRRVAFGVAEGTRHTPSLWNVAYNDAYFWDGRSDALWAQALVPIESPSEMGSSRWIVAERVTGDPRLAELYQRAFGAEGLEAARRGEPTPLFANCGKALAAFQRRIVSGRSKFDDLLDWLAAGGPHSAPPVIETAAVRGALLFIGRAGCRNCHSGPNFTNNSFHNIRLPPDPRRLDRGRFDGVQLLARAEFSARSCHSDAPPSSRPGPAVPQPHEWGAFKTPSLRNVALTAPYMHDGSMATLERVLHHYSTFEGAPPAEHHDELTLQPLRFSPAETADLLAFLRSLTDDSASSRILHDGEVASP